MISYGFNSERKSEDIMIDDSDDVHDGDDDDDDDYHNYHKYDDNDNMTMTYNPYLHANHIYTENMTV